MLPVSLLRLCSDHCRVLWNALGKEPLSWASSWQHGGGLNHLRFIFVWLTLCHWRYAHLVCMYGAPALPYARLR